MSRNRFALEKDGHLHIAQVRGDDDVAKHCMPLVSALIDTINSHARGLGGDVTAPERAFWAMAQTASVCTRLLVACVKSFKQTFPEAEPQYVHGIASKLLLIVWDAVEKGEV